MRKLLAILLTLICFQLSAQPETQKRPALGFSFLYQDFTTVKNRRLASFKDMNAGLAVTYLKGISKHFDFSSTLAGSSLKYIYKNGGVAGTDHLLMELDGSLTAKLWTDDHWITPFGEAGAGLSKYGTDYGFFAPVGAGIQVIVVKDIFLLIKAQYRVGFAGNVNDHFFFSAGIAGNIGKRKPVKKPVVVLAPKAIGDFDKDKDGVPDSVDRCPLVKGPAQYHGCPDTDGDGIPDDLDKCPLTPGFQKYGGCPIPDTDKDGINDEKDSCVLVPGVARYHGCPIPDTDQDGVNNEEDSCVLLAGLKENRGCPLVSEDLNSLAALSAKNIFFITGSYQLSAKSFPALDTMLTILRRQPLLFLRIEGHTDNVGNAPDNLILSRQRAETVQAFLVGKGINRDRLTAIGFGLKRPVASNQTVAGRSKNRRVVFILTYVKDSF